MVPKRRQTSAPQLTKDGLDQVGEVVTSKSSAATDRLIRLPEVLQILPIAKSTFYQGVGTRYPRPIKLGRVSAWKLSDILGLLNRE